MISDRRIFTNFMCVLYFRHIVGYEEVQKKAHHDVEKYIGNPLNSYLLIKKLTSDWKELKDLLSPSDASHQFANLTDNFERPLKWPSEEDLSGAAMGKSMTIRILKIITVIFDTF